MESIKFRKLRRYLVPIFLYRKKTCGRLFPHNLVYRRLIPTQNYLELVSDVSNCKIVTPFHVVLVQSRFVRHFALCILLYEVSKSGTS
jgi:hypothetical protein